MSDQETEVWFYHLSHWPLERVLPSLLEKSLERGWRAIIRSGTDERLEALNAHLWTYRDESFLPHGIDGECDATRQPVLLTSGEANSNDADVLFLIDRAEPGDISVFKRCIHIFDGRANDAVEAARGQWRKAKLDGLPVSYWQQNQSGAFEQKALS